MKNSVARKALQNLYATYLSPIALIKAHFSEKSKAGCLPHWRLFLFLPLMKQIKHLVHYIKQFWKEAGNIPYLLVATLWLGLIIVLFYASFGANLRKYSLIFQAIAYLGTIVLGVWAQASFYKQKIKESRRFWVLMGITLVVLLIRKGFVYHRVWVKQQVPFSLQYLAEQLTVYSFRIFIFALPVYIIWRWYDRKQTPQFYGFSGKTFYPIPYLLLLLCILPFIYYASTTAGFLQQYPIYKSNFAAAYLKLPQWLPLLSFELFYGIDFVFVELFFRGFLIILIGRYFGPQMIILAASIYCIFHLGKPIGETISSFFGGMLLGMFSYYSRSIYGGIILHLGVAYMMEVFAFLQKS